MVRSIKSDDAEDWCKEADFKFKMLRAQNKNKQYYLLFSFLVIFIQLCDLRKSHHLSREFRVKLHLKTDVAFSRAI